MKLRILLVGNYAADQQKSMAAFSKMIGCLLVEDGYTVEILVPAARLLPKNTEPRGFWKWVSYIDKFVLFPLVLKRQAKKFDLVHICDHSNSMYAAMLKNIPTVVTCHDVLAIEAARNLIPGWRVGFTGRLFQRLIFRGLNSAAAVVCVSEYTKSHLKSLGWRGKDISVALNSLNADFFLADCNAISEAAKRAGLMAGANYFLHVGSDLPRKNRVFIVEVFISIRRLYPDLNYQLLFVGPPLSERMKNLLVENQLGDSVSSIQDVSHPMLRALYSGAVGLLFPSLQEGFGWPIIEAQACGCPVFTSNILPMTEVGGDGAIYIDILDKNIAADSIGKSLSDLESIRRRGVVNIERFSKLNMMSGYLSTYVRVSEGVKC